MQLIDANGLSEFAEQDASRRFLPWLVRRLLTAEPGIDGVDVPTGVWRPGWDGVVVDAPGSAFVPRGTSAWEFSNNAHTNSVATTNLDKRTAQPAGVDPENTTFVFVTMRHWLGKRGWLADVRAGDFWRDVRALDSEDLVAWLEMHPDIHRWASRMIASLNERESTIGSELPSDVQGFVGRDAEFTAIEQLLDNEPGPRTVVVWGPPGAGKTALTIHAAHRLADHFPDGRIFFDHVTSGTTRDTGRNDRTPESLLRRVLSRLGFEADALPQSPTELAALYRAELRDHSYLLVVDNVETENDVRLLDPGNSGSLVLVSSRSRLGGLESALRIEASRLSDAEGVRLLEHEIGREISAAESSNALDVVALCDGLPLALRVAGRMAGRNPSWNVVYLARRLEDERRRLSRLKVGDLAVRSSFASAYAALPRRLKRLFRRSCIIPGPSFSVALLHAAAPGEELDDVADILSDLTDRGLVTPLSQTGLYKVHDLLKLFGRERFDCDERPTARDQARNGIGRWLLRGLDETTQALFPQLTQRTFQRTAPVGVALSWLDAHFANVVTLADARHEEGAYNHAIDLCFKASAYCETRNHWDDLANLAHLAQRSIDAIRTKGTVDHENAAIIETLIITMRAKSAWGLRDFGEALRLAESAVAMAPDQLTVAHARVIRSEVLRSLARHKESLKDIRSARATFARLGADIQVEMTMHNTGAILTEMGQPERAIRYLKRDLAGCLERHDRLGQAHTMNSIALAYLRLGEFEQAERLLQDAVEICLECRDLVQAGAAYNDLGLVLAQKSDYTAAYQCHFQDLILCELRQYRRGAQCAIVRAALMMLCIDDSLVPHASKLVENSIAYALDHADDGLLAEASTVYAEIGYMVGKYDDADEMFNLASSKYLELGQHQAALASRVRQLERAKDIGRAGVVGQALCAMANQDLFADDPISAGDLNEALAVVRATVGGQDEAADDAHKRSENPKAD